MGRLFGTDGVRGLANGDLTPELALAVASAAARVLVAHDASHRPLAVVGRDPRASGEMLEAAVVAGLASAGADVLRVGVLPTPAVAFLTASYGADLGVVLSASHNPMPDNGIKLFARGGHKLPDDIEDEIEAAIDDRRRHRGRSVPPSGGCATPTTRRERYLDHLLAGRARRRSTGCTSSSTARTAPPSSVAPELYRRAGARVTAIAAEPGRPEHQRRRRLDPPGRPGRRGARSTAPTSASPTTATPTAAWPSTRPARSSTATRSSRCARSRCASAGTLRDDTVVATVMSNLGFHHAMRAAGIEVLTTAVGDRYVLEALRAKDLNLGGEQSGHVVFTDAATTGDGLLTALHVMARMAATGALAGRARPRSCSGCRRPWSTCGCGDRAAVAVVAVPSPTPSPPPSANSATTDGSCCARPAPSRSSGSWSRRPPSSVPTRSPQRVAAVVGAA